MVSAKLLISEMADLVLSMVKTISLLFAIEMNVASVVSGLSKVAVRLGLSMICLAIESELKPSVWRTC